VTSLGITLFQLTAAALRVWIFYWALSVIVPLTPLYLENPWHYFALGVLLHALSTASTAVLKEKAS